MTVGGHGASQKSHGTTSTGPRVHQRQDGEKSVIVIVIKVSLAVELLNTSSAAVSNKNGTEDCNSDRKQHD